MVCMEEEAVQLMARKGKSVCVCVCGELEAMYNLQRHAHETYFIYLGLVSQVFMISPNRIT